MQLGRQFDDIFLSLLLVRFSNATSVSLGMLEYDEPASQLPEDGVRGIEFVLALLETLLVLRSESIQISLLQKCGETWEVALVDFKRGLAFHDGITDDRHAFEHGEALGEELFQERYHL